ncbi:MAG: V-type ATP synthase subunit D [Desulfobacterales bacterium]
MPANETSPTRMNLLNRRSQHALATRGVNLLQKKRDALVREFFTLVHEALEARRQVNAAGREAHTALILAKSFDGPDAVEVFSLSAQQISEVRVEVSNIWGARVPVLEADWPQSAAVSPFFVGGQTLSAQAAFRRFCRALIRVANTESRLRRIGEEIKKTVRRVNALELAVIPGLGSQIRYIRQMLDQQEQEDIFRLKRVKRKLTSQGGR